MRSGHFEERGGGGGGGRGRGRGRGAYREWGSKEGGGGRDGGGASAGEDKNKTTLTDFRISGLDIPALDWSWRAETVVPPVQTSDEQRAESKVG
jgi:hypothetical protein